MPKPACAGLIKTVKARRVKNNEVKKVFLPIKIDTILKLAK